MEKAEERTFPLTRLNSEVVAVAKARESDASNRVNHASANDEKKRQSKLRKILTQIITALGNSAESSQYYLLNHSSDTETDD
ncbi:MAG: hypothetical protein ABSA92_09745 [Candidatus Bathyarchaeia archaeon]|jgi:hypothetical protein